MNYILNWIITNILVLGIGLQNLHLHWKYFICLTLKNMKNFNVKNEPVLGGRMPLLNVTSHPGRTLREHCVPVIDLGFGFLIWLKDV